jgi:hypothetical protein
MVGERPKLTASEIEAMLRPRCRNCPVCAALNP